ncbi:hypothetical protein GGR57DRAFT_421784 [Xylariaceae sp. FL1272]|nr:hypothetical protein GGR57DRAFT_421784 [Xylariaceae sp. FL1272]
MSSNRAGKVPDAWDDEDWEVQADKATASPEPAADSQALMSRAERLVQHTESNKKLWQSAEAPPEPFHYLAARSDTPLTTDFKPAVKVLSRKPAPQVITKRDPLTGAISQLKVQDDDSDEEKKTVPLTSEEIRAKQQLEREEKQRKYEEVRAKIFGTQQTAPKSASNSKTSSGASTPGNGTPPRIATDSRGPRGRGRGGRAGASHRQSDSRANSRGDSRADFGSQPNPASHELFDPNYTPKPGFQLESRGGGHGTPPLSGRSTPRYEDQVIRSPRGPSDRNNRGFARRGDRKAT